MQQSSVNNSKLLATAYQGRRAAAGKSLTNQEKNSDYQMNGEKAQLSLLVLVLRCKAQDIFFIKAQDMQPRVCIAAISTLKAVCFATPYAL
jgi:hypothetical protein